MFCLDQFKSCWLIFPYSVYLVNAVQPLQSSPCMFAFESECCWLSGIDDRHICGITRSALFCLTEEMRLILSSSVQITERANMPINTLIHLQWRVCVCLYAHVVLHGGVQACCMLHMWCICIASYHCVELGGNDLMHMCGIIHSQWMCVCARVCVCVSLHSTVIISMSVFDGSLHTEHMDACM